MLSNENLLKLIFSTFSLFRNTQLLTKISNKTINRLLLSILNYIDIYKSMGKSYMFLGLKGGVFDKFLLAKDNLLFSAYYNTLEVWNINSNKLISVSCFDDFEFDYKLIINKNNILASFKSSFFESKIRLWDIKGKPKCIYTITCDLVTNISFLTNGDLVCTNNNHNNFLVTTITIYDNNDYTTILKVLTMKTFKAYALVNISESLLAISGETNIKIWDIKNNYECFKTLDTRDKILSFLYIKKYDILVLGSKKHLLRIRDTNNNFKLTRVVCGHNDKILFLELLPNDFVVSGSKDNRLRIWDINNFKCITIIKSSVNFTSLIVLQDNRIALGLRQVVAVLNY
jgi:hypothetical protein